MKYRVKFWTYFYADIEAIDEKHALNKARNIAAQGKLEEQPDVQGWANETIEEVKE